VPAAAAGQEHRAAEHTDRKEKTEELSHIHDSFLCRELAEYRRAQVLGKDYHMPGYVSSMEQAGNSGRADSLKNKHHVLMESRCCLMRDVFRVF
jgi:hypothetical protein